MALKIIVTIAKKVPISGITFASSSAACTLEGEISVGQDPHQEAARLYQQAEKAVDGQLGILVNKPASVPVAVTPSAVRTSAPDPALSAVQSVPSALTRPYPKRRTPLVTMSQLALIERLLRETKTDGDAVLAHYQCGALNQLSCRDASELIDEMKARQTGAVRS